MNYIEEKKTDEFDMDKINAVCHLFPALNEIESPTSYCGVPRREQAPHGKWYGNKGLCKCGLMKCPKCVLAAEWRKKGAMGL